MSDDALLVRLCRERFVVRADDVDVVAQSLVRQGLVRNCGWYGFRLAAGLDASATGGPA